SETPRRPRRAPSRRLTVLAGTVAGSPLARATRTTWAQATAPDLTGSAQQVAVTGSDAAPTVLALGLVALAASLTTSLSSTWVRLVTGPVLLAAGLGAGWSALAVVLDPIGASGSAAATATGVVGGQVQATATAWPLLTLIPALAVAAVGALVLLVGPTWPVRTRYRSAAVVATADPETDPAAAWDALTRGEDPSAEDDPSAGRDETGPTAAR
ncbi:MAG: Trp biosynthesis-associated membrane protein, partial [Brachybacterium sp.]|uniref:Trp biosynthesis-associated membrane protein n=1 Tax=Brachybacterium sp. TaxID=1891286 RepID=UPI0026483E87